LGPIPKKGRKEEREKETKKGSKERRKEKREEGKYITEVVMDIGTLMPYLPELVLASRESAHEMANAQCPHYLNIM
jgi:hypothetical protein